MYTVSVDMPNLTPGAEVELHGLGVFKNGEAVELDKDVAAQFTVTHGQTPLQAFKASYGVTITSGNVEKFVEDNPDFEAVGAVEEEKPAPTPTKRAPRKVTK